jgi:peptide chain release factor 1
MRSTGPGGQHVNKTNSAVRVIHKPSGIFVKSNTFREAHRNKEQAEQLLCEKINEQVSDLIHVFEGHAPVDASRSTKIKTYNFPENRITDHRAGITMHNLQEAFDKVELMIAFINKVNDYLSVTKASTKQ